MAGSQRGRRIAWIGLTLTVLAITGLGLVGAASTRSSAETVARSSALAAAYSRANQAVAREETLERRYRLERGNSVRASHAVAGAAVHSALGEIERTGGPADRELVARLRVLHDQYLDAVLEIFSAVDLGEPARAAAISGDRVEPIFTEISKEVQRAADMHMGIATAAVADLRRVQTLVFVLSCVAAAFGMALVTALVLVMNSYQRTLLRHSRLKEYEASHDALTGLANRTLFADRLDTALMAARGTDASVAVLLLDLNRFKEVNDTLGHQCGDELLKQVAGRLAAGVRELDTVARLSGDEFAALLPGADATVATEVANRVIDRLHQSYEVMDVHIEVGASAGIAVAPTHAGTATELIRCADVAMYAAKDAGGGSVLYVPAAGADRSSRLQLLGDLRQAVERGGELVLAYQPQVDLRDGRLHGVEALVRWLHPSRGLLPPGQFLPLVGSTGLMSLLTSHILRTAIAQAAAWSAAGQGVPVAVNLGVRCVCDPGLPDRVDGLLERHRVPGRLLRLEVPAAAVRSGSPQLRAVLGELADLGVSLSLDAYGTAHPAPAQLRRLPLSELKLDPSLLADGTGAPVRDAVEVGRALGLTVVAVGVADAGQAALLCRLGCDVGQGPHFAEPMPAVDLIGWAGRDPAAPALSAVTDG